MKPLLVGIAGGTGSGKTTVAAKIRSFFPHHCICIAHDSYYKDQSHLSLSRREEINYDHPDSLETQLLTEQIKSLKDGKKVKMPMYDFSQYARLNKTKIICPHKIIIVEGILLFLNEELRNMIDIKLFVDTDADIRLGRRITRDIQERGRTLNFSLNQYLTMSRPMHLAFVEPTKKYADIILPHGGDNILGIEIVVNAIRQSLNK